MSRNTSQLGFDETIDEPDYVFFSHRDKPCRISDKGTEVRSRDPPVRSLSSDDHKRSSPVIEITNNFFDGHLCVGLMDNLDKTATDKRFHFNYDPATVAIASEILSTHGIIWSSRCGL